MQRKGSAVWKGGLKDGNGQVSTGSGGLSLFFPFPYLSSFANRLLHKSQHCQSHNGEDQAQYTK